MDKNMINIDDLVRQKLNGEEREKPGAWLNMRELLDQKMPTAPPRGGYNWRRMFGLVTGLALLATATVGSYQLVTSYRNTTEGPEVAKTGSPASGVSSNAPAEGKPSVTAANTSNSQQTNAPTEPVTERNTIAEAYTRAAGVPAITANSSKTDNTPAQNPTIASANRQRNAAATTGNELPVVTDAKRANASGHHSNSSTIGNIDASSSSSGPLLASTGVIKTSAPDQLAVNKDISSTAVSSSNGLSKSMSVAPAANEYQASTPDNTNITTQPAPEKPGLLRDSFNQMTVIRRTVINPITRTSKIINDTVSVERLAIEKSVVDKLLGVGNTPSSDASRSLSLASSEAVSLKIAADEQLAEMMPLSNFKVNSTKTNRWNTRSFDEVMRDMKFNLSQIRFYPGISAGGNSYMFGANNFSGFQIGLFGLLTFGENLSAMAELKYVHRFNGGATLNDNYTDVRTAPNGAGYLQAEVEHFFKFSALQSIEMPLALRYAAGRVNIFAGMNIAYNFGVNPEEIYIYTSEAHYIPTTSPSWGDNKPRVSYKDFGSRVSLGGLAGVSYELSPSVQLDLRATRNVWDNSFGIGAAQVSQELYRTPSFQFSLYYRFSQRNKIPKAR